MGIIRQLHNLKGNHMIIINKRNCFFILLISSVIFSQRIVCGEFHTSKNWIEFIDFREACSNEIQKLLEDKGSKFNNEKEWDILLSSDELLKKFSDCQNRSHSSHLRKEIARRVKIKNPKLAAALKKQDEWLECTPNGLISEMRSMENRLSKRLDHYSVLVLVVMVSLTGVSFYYGSSKGKDDGKKL